MRVCSNLATSLIPVAEISEFVTQLKKGKIQTLMQIFSGEF